METRHIVQVEQELSEQALKRSRSAETIEWIAPSGLSQPGAKTTVGGV